MEEGRSSRWGCLSVEHANHHRQAAKSSRARAAVRCSPAARRPPMPLKPLLAGSCQAVDAKTQTDQRQRAVAQRDVHEWWDKVDTQPTTNLRDSNNSRGPGIGEKSDEERRTAVTWIDYPAAAESPPAGPGPHPAGAVEQVRHPSRGNQPFSDAALQADADKQASDISSRPARRSISRSRRVMRSTAKYSPGQVRKICYE